MQIREVVQSDFLDLFSWRNDKTSREMFRNSSLITIDEHSNWLEEAIKNKNKQIFIGLDGKNNKVGVCRFDVDDKMRNAEVSLNLNPHFRGKGLSRELLEMSLLKFRKNFNNEIIANVKPSNIPSLKVFENCNFYFKKKNKDTLLYTDKISISKENVLGINLEKIVNTPQQIRILFELLNQRLHSISHESVPSFRDHQKFVEKNPYRVWYLVLSDFKCIGSFYIQNDNSIGLNINKLDPQKLDFCVNYIKTNYYPFPEIKSKIPGYFYLNAPSSDKNYLSIIGKLNLKPIQTSFKL